MESWIAQMEYFLIHSARETISEKIADKKDEKFKVDLLRLYHKN